MNADGVTLHVCTSCGRAAEGDSAGARLLAALGDAAAAESAWLSVRPVECLSVCKRPCTVALSAAGRWTYVYGDLEPGLSAATLVAGARLYAAAPDGVVPWRERPEALKRGVIARVPPLS